VPDPAASIERRSDGTVAGSEAARTLGARGGRARAHRARLASALGLRDIADDHAFRPYRDAGEAWAEAQLASLANVAGGEVGPGPASMIASAGVQLAASRWCSDQAADEGDPALFHRASTLANDSRQNLLAAHELAIREAKARDGDPRALVRQARLAHAVAKRRAD